MMFSADLSRLEGMNTKTFLTFVAISLLFLINSFDLALAQGMETKEIIVESATTGSEARSEAFQKAIEDLSYELGSSRLGKEFLESNKDRFDKEVLSQSSKYILSVKGRKGESESEMKVELSYSSEAFDRVLRQSGLVQLSRQNLRAILFIEDKDQAVGSGPWWTKEAAEMKPNAQEIYKLLSRSLNSRGIEVIPVSTVNKSLPAEFKKANLNREELVAIGNRMGATLVYFGLVSPRNKAVIYHGQWIQVPAARILDEVQGEAKTQELASSEIMVPVKAAQAQGTLNTKPFLLTIRGDLAPRELESIRSQMKSGIGDLRSMKERIIKQGEFTFEAESPQTPKALADIIKTLSFQDFQHRVSLNGEDEILLRVEKR